MCLNTEQLYKLVIMLSEHLRHTGNIKLFTETRLAMEAYDICYNKLTAQ